MYLHHDKELKAMIRDLNGMESMLSNLMGVSERNMPSKASVESQLKADIDILRMRAEERTRQVGEEEALKRVMAGRPFSICDIQNKYELDAYIQKCCTEAHMGCFDARPPAGYMEPFKTPQDVEDARNSWMTELIYFIQHYTIKMRIDAFHIPSDPKIDLLVHPETAHSIGRVIGRGEDGKLQIVHPGGYPNLSNVEVHDEFWVPKGTIYLMIEAQPRQPGKYVHFVPKGVDPDSGVHQVSIEALDYPPKTLLSMIHIIDGKAGMG